MALWSDGYFTDVNYTDGYFRELSPLFLNLNLTLAGFDVPNNRISNIKDINYLELAFGLGTSINIHAATIDGEFYGTDFNPNQVLIAKNRSIKNHITLYDDSFEELLERLKANPIEFDYIVLHGIFSWISENNRKFILEIIKRFLKVGGVVYNSYNALPGWSPKAPSREILRLYNDLYNTPEMNIGTQIQNNIQFLERFFNTNPAFIQSVAHNKELLEQLKKYSSTYIPHEYLNQTWDCFYFHEVATLFEGAKCSFATTAEVMRYFNECNLTQEASSFLDGIQDQIFKEQLRDYYVNRQFRKDIFIKGARRIPTTLALKRILDTKFILINSAKLFKEKMGCVLGEMSLDVELYKKVLEFLESEKLCAKSAREIIEHCKIEHSLVIQVLMILIEQGLVGVAQDLNDDIRQRALEYNKKQCLEHCFGEASVYLAAPSIASSIALSAAEQVVMYAYFQGSKKESELANFLLKTYKESNRGFLKDGKVVQKESEIKEVAKGIAKGFLEMLPMYQALGVV